MIHRLLSIASIYRIGGQAMLAAALLAMLPVLPVLTLSLIASWQMRTTLLEMAHHETAAGLEELDRFILERIGHYQIDARTIANYPPINGLYRAEQNGGVDPIDGSTTDQWHDRLAELFISYTLAHPDVQQVRYLDHLGQEKLRVNLVGNQAVPVPSESLQNQSDRPYFRGAIALPEGECYITPIDLNVAQNKLHRDNPVLRISTPLWQGDQLQGVIVINISGKSILHTINQHFDSGRVIFANESGSYISHPDEDRNWSDQLGTDHGLYRDWPGLSLDAIKAHWNDEKKEPLRLTSKDGATELSLSYIRFDDHNAGWIVGLECDRATVLAANTAMTRYFVFTALGVGLVAGLLALFGSAVWTRPIRQISKAADAVRSGDYGVRVHTRRGDELGELAESFNQMTAELDAGKDAERERAEAIAANNAKSAFLANMSHEIRTPMNAILGFASLLSEPEVSDSDRKDYIQTIQRNGDHLLCLINDVLDLSKIESGRMNVECVDISLTEMISRVGSLMRGSARQKGLTLNVQRGDGLPEIIRTDPVRLRQILLNLLGNAVKFTDRGSVTLFVYRDTSNAGDHAEDDRCELVFEVRDTGVGIEPSHMRKLFRPFTQADPSITRNFGGTGLGLVLSKNFATMLDGDIEAESSPGKGSIFRLRIRPKLVSNPDQTAARNKSKDKMQLEPQHKGRILVVEDGPDNQRLILFHLKKLGYQAFLRENGRDGSDLALAQLEKGTPFDMILMDMQMPIMDGYTATKRLRENGYHHPIAALTAHAMTGDRERCIRAGCDDYATKPIDRQKLQELLTAYQHHAKAA